MISWTDALSIDDGVIDQDHKWLIGLVNEFKTEKALPFDVLHEMVYQLERYTEIHFVREEDLQRRVGFPLHDDHVREHRSLSARVRSLHKRLHDSGDAAQLQSEAFDLLEDWFLRHIQGHDVDMRPYAAQLRLHGATLPALEHSSET